MRIRSALVNLQSELHRPLTLVTIGVWQKDWSVAERMSVAERLECGRKTECGRKNKMTCDILY
jgi:hypothetical protein